MVLGLQQGLQELADCTAGGPSPDVLALRDRVPQMGSYSSSEERTQLAFLYWDARMQEMLQLELPSVHGELIGRGQLAAPGTSWIEGALRLRARPEVGFCNGHPHQDNATPGHRRAWAWECEVRACAMVALSQRLSESEELRWQRKEDERDAEDLHVLAMARARRRVEEMAERGEPQWLAERPRFATAAADRWERRRHGLIGKVAAANNRVDSLASPGSACTCPKLCVL